MDVLTVKINDFQINDDVFVISDNRHKKRNSLLGPCKKYVTPKRAIFEPPPPMSHFVIFSLDPPPPNVTHQKVTNFLLKKVNKYCRGEIGDL